MKRSARGTTVVWTEPLVLLAVFGSEVAELTEAELEIGPAPESGARTEMTRLGAVAPIAKLARVQVPVVVPLPTRRSSDLLTSVTPGGRESLTVTAEAASGPALLTLRV